MIKIKWRAILCTARSAMTAVLSTRLVLSQMAMQLRGIYWEVYNLQNEGELMGGTDLLMAMEERNNNSDTGYSHSLWKGEGSTQQGEYSMHLDLLNDCCKNCIKGLINPKGWKANSKTKSLYGTYQLRKCCHSVGVKRWNTPMSWKPSRLGCWFSSTLATRADINYDKDESGPVFNVRYF